MTKTELSAAVAEQAGLSKKDAEKAVSTVLDVIVEALEKGEKVQLVGFGTFEVRERAARTGKNPGPVKPSRSQPAKCRPLSPARP